MSDPRRHIARLAPLLPQLVFAFRRRRGEIPDVLKQAGSQGERHIGALISLAIMGPATVSELAQRTEMSTAHASLVVGELARSGLVDRDHDERDRRRIVVSLSSAAKPAVAEMRKRNSAPLLQFLSELGDDEAERFIDHLDRLVALLRAEDSNANSPDTTMTSL
jgi:DNA-binding MarR family transcriptional regulator